MLIFVFLTTALFASAQSWRLVQVAQNLTAPTDIQHSGDGTGRLFVTEQAGVIRIVRDGTVFPQPFLDIRSRVLAGGERGLLGLAFPPRFAESGRFYVDYTDRNGATVIAQYRVTANADIADAASERILMTIPQPFSNHNGGQIRFGPDGYLYVAMGDGGSSGDPQGNAQNLGSLLGKILRIDVESVPGEVRVPPDNPFVNQAGARPEVWAYGLRNPWRFSFDRATGDLWIADVGQGAVEEVNYQPASSRGGENYGWVRMEGSRCYRAATCSREGLTLPVIEYGHDNNACSVTGGFVYRGSRYPGMRGMYLFGDYCNGWIWETSRVGGQFETSAVLDSDLLLTTFGEDEAGEVYLGSSRQNALYRLEGPAALRFSPADVVNSASFAPGISAGSLATVFAAGVRDTQGIAVAENIPLPSSLGGVSVKVGGVTAPVYSVSNVNGVEQVNFQVPFEVAGRTTVDLALVREGLGSTVRSVELQPLSPAVYTSNGVRAIVVRNRDYSLVSEQAPLDAGEEVFFYATGLGAVTNAPATGAASPGSPVAEVRVPVTLTLGGVAADVQFAGLAPGFVGVYQVNFRVPGGTGSGLRELKLGSSTVLVPVR